MVAKDAVVFGSVQTVVVPGIDGRIAGVFQIKDFLGINQLILYDNIRPHCQWQCQ